MDLSYNPAMTKAPMVEAQSLTKWYGAIRAISDVSFSLAAGEVLGYLDPTGPASPRPTQVDPNVALRHS